MFTFHFSQLAFSAAPGSLVSAIIGVFAGQLYRSDFFNLKTYQLPPWLIRLSSNMAPYVIGSTRPPRRTNLALREASTSRPSLASVLRASVGGANDEDEGPITTTRQSASSTPRLSTGGRGDNSRRGTTTSVMRDWVNELTGRDGTSPALRIPSEAEISQVSAMFPNVGREAVVGALQRRYVWGSRSLLVIPRYTEQRHRAHSSLLTLLPHFFFSRFRNVPKQSLISKFHPCYQTMHFWRLQHYHGECHRDSFEDRELGERPWPENIFNEYRTFLMTLDHAYFCIDALSTIG